ncbi:hypothetical protein T08_7221 [Trichinella sp. T8]|nr:hypothetical protein T08_7221 [Trichinella sp. T8]
MHGHACYTPRVSDIHDDVTISKRVSPICVDMRLPDLELRDLFSENQWSEIRDALTVNRIKWKYITERTPWNGGYWERIVQSVKELLKKVLGNTRLEEDELRTVLCEIEARINSRPLNFVGDDPNDPNPLTPFHFLIRREYRNVHNIPHGEDNDPTYGAPTAKELSRRWKYRRTLVDNLWKRWKSEYVVNLSQRKKWTKSKQEPHVGDIMLVSEDDVPTHMWPMARIIEVYPGSDGVVRTVKVKTLKRSIRIEEPSASPDKLDSKYKNFEASSKSVRLWTHPWKRSQNARNSSTSPENTGIFSSGSLSFTLVLLLLQGPRSLELAEQSDKKPSICRILARASRRAIWVRSESATQCLAS